MSKKKSSFQMGNQFNGYGDTVYLKADTVKLPPISQDNVQPTPDYSRYALHAVDGGPAVLNPEATSQDISKMVDSISTVSRVSLAKNESNGSYVANFSVSSNGFIDNSYATYNVSKKVVKKSYRTFFAKTSTNLLVKRVRTTRKEKEYIIGNIGSGQQVEVVLENNQYVYATPEDETNSYKWIKVKHVLENEYKQGNEIAGTEMEGWVPRVLIREDKKQKIFSKELYDYSKVSMYKKFKDTEANKKENRVGEMTEIVNSFADWGVVGGGGYKGVDNKTYGKWDVAVGPGIIDWEYPDDGGVRDDDMKGFSKFIKVFLSLKEDIKDPKKKKKQTIECYLYDLKAHTYNIYPYSDQMKAKLKEDKCPKTQYESDYVDDASASVEDELKRSGLIRSGLIQTGIKSPYVSGEKRAVVSFDHMDGSVIEFCGESVNLGFKAKDYVLDYIEVNYEDTTRGEAIKKKN